MLSDTLCEIAFWKYEYRSKLYDLTVLNQEVIECVLSAECFVGIQQGC